MSSTALPSYSSKLHSTRVLVVGGSSGIGFGVASAAYDNGAHVIVSSSSQEKVERAVERIRSGYPSPAKTAGIEGIVCDLANKDKLEDNLKCLLDGATKNGPLNHIAFTAGDALQIKPLTETSVEHIQSCGIVRFIAPLLLSKLILQRIKEEGSGAYLSASPDSSLTFTSGSATQKPAADGWEIVAGYGSGLEGASRSLAKDLKPIRVNVVSPGAVETELFANIPEERREKVLEFMRKETTTGRIGRPQDLAESYLYCMRDGFVTGKVIGSDGGRLLN